MANTAILQWNCRGLRANYNDLCLLLAQFNPIAVCLQEINIPSTYNNTIRSYSLSHSTPVHADGQPCGCVAILVRNNIPHSPISITSNLQVVAVRITSTKPFTLCSIYLPPHSNWNTNDLQSVVQQLPHPVLLLGDFNAHSTLWGNKSTDSKGTAVEDLLLQNNLCLLNNKQHTYVHPATGSFSSIDLSLCDPSLFLDLSWSVHNDQCGSDHFPIIIQQSIRTPTGNPQRWKLLKAKWDDFNDQCSSQLTSDQITRGGDNIEAFTKTLLDIANNTIPKTKPVQSAKSKPWYSDECKEAVKNRIDALKRFTQSPSTRWPVPRPDAPSVTISATAGISSYLV